jgi:hypothetical protein
MFITLKELRTRKQTGYLACLHQTSVIVGNVIERILFEALHLFVEECPVVGRGSVLIQKAATIYGNNILIVSFKF